MRYLSICSGIATERQAWAGLKWRCAGFAEIDPYACSLLAHHHPGITNHGDFTQIQPADTGPVDLIIGGTPCQGFSTAGRRDGIHDPRSRLALKYVSLVARFRPRWLVWENVCGVLDNRGGRDFGALLGLLAQLGYGLAWRVIDIQFCRTHNHPRAIPQSRRRVFLVGHLGDWRPPAAVLFEPGCIAGRPPPRREIPHQTPPGDHRDAGERNQPAAPTLTSKISRGSFDSYGGRLHLVGHAPTMTTRQRYQKVATGGQHLIPTEATSLQTSQHPIHKTEVSLPVLPNPHGNSVAGKTALPRGYTPLECERLFGIAPQNTRFTLVVSGGWNLLPHQNPADPKRLNQRMIRIGTKNSDWIPAKAIHIDADIDRDSLKINGKQLNNAALLKHLACAPANIQRPHQAGYAGQDSNFPPIALEEIAKQYRSALKNAPKRAKNKFWLYTLGRMLIAALLPLGKHTKRSHTRFDITIERGYTVLPGPDGRPLSRHRRTALTGNAIGINALTWLGARIQLCEDLLQNRQDMEEQPAGSEDDPSTPVQN